MLEKLEKWIVEEGTMPHLRELEIKSCCKLKQLEGLELATTLQDLILTNMPDDFVTNVKKSPGQACIYQREQLVICSFAGQVSPDTSSFIFYFVPLEIFP